MGRERVPRVEQQHRKVFLFSWALEWERKKAISVEERKKERRNKTHKLDPPPRKRKTKTKKQLTWLIVASVAAPALGLLFAWQTYGTLWG